MQQPDPASEARFVGHDDARDASRLAEPRAKGPAPTLPPGKTG